MKVVDIVVEEQRAFGEEGGFLVLKRVRARNRRADGSLSNSYVVDYTERPRARDAVVVVVYCRPAGAGGPVEVLIRSGLRPPLSLSRSDEHSLFCEEVVAGLIEKEDLGVDGIKRRASMEVWEESGFRVEASAIELLGSHSYPSPGAFPEAFWFTAAEIPDRAAQHPELEGDGSPMEEGASTRWLELNAAIAACVAGEIRDLKSEAVLRRLRDHLDYSPKAEKRTP